MIHARVGNVFREKLHVRINYHFETFEMQFNYDTIICEAAKNREI